MPRPRSLSTSTGASMRAQLSTDGPTTMPPRTISTAPGTGSRGSSPSTTGTRTEIPAMISRLLNERGIMN